MESISLTIPLDYTVIENTIGYLRSLQNDLFEVPENDDKTNTVQYVAEEVEKVPTISNEPMEMEDVPSAEVVTLQEPESLPPDAIGSVELDYDKLPWDARIHVKSRAINKDGRWRKKQRLDPEFVAQVETELRAVMAVPVADTEPSAQEVFGAMPTVAPGVIDPVQQAAAQPVVPVPPTNVLPAPAATDFTTFLQKVTSRNTDPTHGVIFSQKVNEILTQYQVGNIVLLGTARPNLIPEIDAELDKQWKIITNG